ncbi:MAG: hypothetical protein JEZ01_11595 [Labilibaculum sp.]|nr:hypothetical protein [Labilibaculum sp.]MBI9058396.1 hypothetical protein [Labilibaculum sp.]
MTFEEIKELKNMGITPSPLRSRSLFHGKINVNHKIALKVESIASIYKTDLDVSVYSPTGDEIGVLVFTKELGKTNWGNLTENQFVAFLNEASFPTRNDDYIFKNNYLLVNDSFYLEYIENHKDLAPLWGNFSHPSSDLMYSYNKTISQINIENYTIDKRIFIENAKRSVLQPFAHERFLKLYHLLELRFDSDIIEEVKQLDIDIAPEKIGQIFSNYSKNELPRLQYIIEHNCNDINSLVLLMNNINNYTDVAQNIFYKFGKESNPFKSEVQFLNVVPLGFSEQNLRANSLNFQNNYSFFIKKLVAYWIYRIRCSIAHNKIGEYILSYNDEKFIAEFAEPLIKEIIKQCFR